MSDRAKYYETIRARAGVLRDDVDEGINVLLKVERRVQEIGEADFGEPAELSATNLGDLKTCAEQALFYLRLLEHITHNHLHELDEYLDDSVTSPQRVKPQLVAH